MIRFILANVLICATLWQLSFASAIELPDLGDPSSAIISPQQEHQTGQAFLKALYRQVPISEDPLLYSYLDELTRKLVFNSPLKLKSFYLVVVNSPAFNAFAAPGNVMGINLGLLLYADSEDELSSVITHEIGHLSQRHYTRSLERRKSQSFVSLASFIGGLLIMASGQADAGMAAITAGQAAAINNQLQYSRLDEQEADRIGIETLYRSGMNPAAAANMFQHMQMATRYREDIKQFDFLLTHPLTESRIADALNQSRLYPSRADTDSLSFHLMKARAQVFNFKNPKLAIKYFSENITKYPQSQSYGLALAYLADKKSSLAEPLINNLYQNAPHNIAFIALKSELLMMKGKPASAIQLLRKHLAISPNHLVLTLSLVEALTKNGQMNESASLLASLINKQPHTPAHMWYLLAENYGLAGNVKEVHKARAEYFIAVGAFKDAQRHLKLALPMEKHDRQAAARIRTRIEEVKVLEKEKAL